MKCSCHFGPMKQYWPIWSISVKPLTWVLIIWLYRASRLDLWFLEALQYKGPKVKRPQVIKRPQFLPHAETFHFNRPLISKAPNELSFKIRMNKKSPDKISESLPWMGISRNWSFYVTCILVMWLINSLPYSRYYKTHLKWSLIKMQSLRLKDQKIVKNLIMYKLDSFIDL